LGSFADAAFALSLAGLPISPQHVRTLAHEVGADLARQRDAKAARGRRRLPARVAQTPALVAVEVDGGRLRTRAPGTGPGVHDQENKEAKVACLVTLRGEVYAHDPQPEPPPSFLQPRRVERLVRQMAGQAGEALPETALAPTPSDAPSEGPTAAPSVEPWAPRKQLRTCVASMADSRAFGRLVAAEAQERDFYRAARRAFVADGAAYNWAIGPARQSVGNSTWCGWAAAGKDVLTRCWPSCRRGKRRWGDHRRERSCRGPMRGGQWPRH
jgi:hypothetical protein